MGRLGMDSLFHPMSTQLESTLALESLFQSLLRITGTLIDSHTTTRLPALLDAIPCKYLLHKTVGDTGTNNIPSRHPSPRFSNLTY